MRNKGKAMLGMVLAIGLLAGCASKNETNTGTSAAGASASAGATATASPSLASKDIKSLKISYVPSKDPQQIITTTEPLKALLTEQLATKGYKVEKVDISVGTTYEAVGEALDAGTTDIGLIPGGTYALYDKGADVILTATRAGLSNDSDKAKDWNDHKPTKPTADQASYYRALFIAGPTEKGKTLAQKVNSGQDLTWDDLNGANWAVMSTSSSAGYIYPTLWLQSKYNKSLTDLKNVVTSDSYASSFARLANGQADILVAYADARRDYETNWTSTYGRKASIWDETNVIGVTQPIYNDTISVSKNDPLMTADFKAALQQSFIDIAKTDAGKKVIAIYSHEGYRVAKAADYDDERKAQALIKSMKK